MAEPGANTENVGQHNLAVEDNTTNVMGPATVPGDLPIHSEDTDTVKAGAGGSVEENVEPLINEPQWRWKVCAEAGTGCRHWYLEPTYQRYLPYCAAHDTVKPGANIKNDMGNAAYVLSDSTSEHPITNLRDINDEVGVPHFLNVVEFRVAPDDRPTANNTREEAEPVPRNARIRPMALVMKNNPVAANIMICISAATGISVSFSISWNWGRGRGGQQGYLSCKPTRATQRRRLQRLMVDVLLLVFLGAIIHFRVFFNTWKVGLRRDQRGHGEEQVGNIPPPSTRNNHTTIWCPHKEEHGFFYVPVLLLVEARGGEIGGEEGLALRLQRFLVDMRGRKTMHAVLVGVKRTATSRSCLQYGAWSLVEGLLRRWLLPAIA
ncbi:hypothetical protein BDQ17DRAFT_1331381 [Cyathus striatus]|nr:hypothetical protein BDQ17DRAFT_1331381 [Cyathus striatus]